MDEPSYVLLYHRKADYFNREKRRRTFFEDSPLDNFVIKRVVLYNNYRRFL